MFRRSRLLGSLVLAATALPEAVHAQTLNPCFGALGLPCLMSPGAGGMVAYVATFILPGLLTVFFALAIAYFFYYGIRLVLESDEENTITEVKNAYGYGIAGSIIVSLASFFAEAFSDPNDIIQPEPIEESLMYVVNFMFLIVSISMTAAIVYLGTRLILLQGQESEMDEQKKRFFNGLLGVAIIILAKTVINTFVPGEHAGILAGEIAGIINFVLTLLGAMAVLSFIVAGIMLMLAADDAFKDRAKKILFTTVIAMIIVFASLMIVRFVLIL